MPAMLPASSANAMPQPWPSETPDEIYCRAVESERRDNHADAADLYQEAAIRGHLSAMVALGRHLIGLDDRTSVGWFRAAAERGHPTAWTELGHMYARGYGVERSNPHAVACWQRGAMLGDNPAKSCLGLSYIQGFGVEKDAEKGIGIVRQIAESGDVISMRNLAWVYRTGRGVPKNAKEAEYWDERAARAAPVSNKPVLHPTPPDEPAGPTELAQDEPPAQVGEPETFDDIPESTEQDVSMTREEEDIVERDLSPTRDDILQDAPDSQEAEDLEMLDALDEVEEPQFLDARDPAPAPMPEEEPPRMTTEAMTTEAKVQGANIPPKTTSDPRSQVRNLKLVDNGIDESSFPGQTDPSGAAAADGEVDLSPKSTGNTAMLSPTVTYLKLVPVTSHQERTYIATETTEGDFEESPNPVIAVVKSPTEPPSEKQSQQPASHQTEPLTGVSSQAAADLETLIEMKEQSAGRQERETPSLEVEAAPRMRITTPEPASPQQSVPYVTTQRRGSFWGSPGGGHHPGTASGLEVVDSALTKLKSGSNSSLGLSSFSSIPHTKVREIFPNNGDSPSALEGPGFAFQHVEEFPIESQEKQTPELGSSSRRDMERKLSRESVPLEVHPASLRDQDVEKKTPPGPLSKSTSSASGDEDVAPKRPSALEAARKAILHHSKPVKRRSSLSPEKGSNTFEAKRNIPVLDKDVHQDAEGDDEADADAVEVPPREPVAAVVDIFEKKELQSKGLIPPPPPPPPPPPALPGAPAREGVERAPAPPVVSRTNAPPVPVVSRTNDSSPSVFKRQSGFMKEIESSYAKFPSSPERSESREAVYNFVDVAQRLRADDAAEGAYLTKKRAWDLVVAAMFSHPRDVCIQERSLHALIRLLRFIPEVEKEDAVLRSCQECFAGLPHERLRLPVEMAPQESGPLQGIIYAMRNFPSTRLVQMAGCAALADLAEVSVESRVATVNLGAVTQIALALEQKDGNVMSTVFEMACRAVSAICSGPDMVDLKQAMAEQRIVEAIIAGLERWTATAIRDDEYLLFATRSACAALRHVCTSCKEACLHALNSNVFRGLTHALKVYMADTATCTVAIAAIIAIATVLGEQAEPSLEENEVLPTVLASMKTHPNDALLVRKSLMCLETLGACKGLQKHAVELGTVEATVAAAENHKDDPRVQEQACSTLERLSHYCTAGKDAVASSNGMRIIAQAFSQHPDDIGVVERAALAASSTCTNHSVNQNSALQMGLAGNVVRALGVHGRQSDKLVIACSTAITALAQAKDPVMGRKMAREEAPEHLISSLECHIDSADVVEHTAYALATLCVADGDLPNRLTRLNVEKAIMKAFKLHIATSRCVLAILSAIRVSVAKPNQLRLRFMTDQSTGTGLAQLIHQALVHHMNPFPESNMVVLICGTLNFLAFECVPHKNEIGSTGIIEKLAEMIQIASQDANVVGLQPSLATVCTLVLNSPENQDRFQALNGVEMTLELMKKWHKNPKVLEHCCIALRYSCNQHRGNCDDMKRLHGVKSLVGVMKSHLDDPRLFEMACLALAVLCQGDKEIQESPNVSEAIKATCEAMEAFPGDPVVQVAACTLFLSATFENEGNKKRVVRYGGRTGIVNALEGHPGHLELAEAGSYALLHVENVEVPGIHRPDVKKASDEIENSGRSRRGDGVQRTSSRNRISFSRSRGRRASQDAGPSGGDREAEPIAEVEREDDIIVDDSPKLSRRSRRYSRSGRGSSAEVSPPPKKSGSLSFLKFGRSRSKKNMRPAVVPDEPEPGAVGVPDFAGEQLPDVNEPVRQAAHHGYSEEGYPGEGVRQAIDPQAGEPIEDVYDKMHAAYNDDHSAATGSGHEFYSVG